MSSTVRNGEVPITRNMLAEAEGRERSEVHIKVLSSPKPSNSLIGWGITMATNKQTTCDCHWKQSTATIRLKGFLGVHWKGRGMRKVSTFKNSQTSVLKKCKENCIQCQVRKTSGSRLIKLWYQKTSSNPHLSISLHIIMILLNTYFSQKRGDGLYRNPIWHKMIILTQIPLKKKKNMNLSKPVLHSQA